MRNSDSRVHQPKHFINALNDAIKNRTPTQDDEEIEAMRRQEEEQRRQAVIRRYVPQRYWNNDFNSFHRDAQPEAFDAARKFVKRIQEGKPANLILLGDTGTGKTHLAYAVMREFGVEKCVYEQSASLKEKWEAAGRAAYYKGNEESERGKFTGAGLLVIDEVGRSDDAEILLRVIDGRYNNMKPTMIISNFVTKEKLMEYLGGAAIGRLAQSGIAIEMHGANYRVALKEEW